MLSVEAGQSDAGLLHEIGPALDVDVGYDPEFGPGGARPQLAGRRIRALIDTGAKNSCIDSSLALALGLPVVNQRQGAGVGGVATFNTHLGQIHIPGLKYTFHGEFMGVHLTVGDQAARVLIGRDVLRHFRLTYDGPKGAVSLSDPDAPASEWIWQDD